MRNSLFFDFDRETKIALCKEPNFPLEIAIEFVDVDDSEMALAFLDRKDLLEGNLNMFVTSKKKDVRAKVAQSNAINIDDLKKLLNDVSDDVVIEALKNPNMTTNILDEYIDSGFIFSHSESVILEISRLATVKESQINKIIEIDKKNFQIFLNKEKLTLSLILNLISNKNLSNFEVNQLMNNIFYECEFDSDRVELSIPIVEEMIRVRPDNEYFIENTLPSAKSEVLLQLSRESYINCSQHIYEMAFSQFRDQYYTYGYKKVLEILSKLVCSKHLNYHKLRITFEIFEIKLKRRCSSRVLYNEAPESAYENILQNLVSNINLNDECIRLVYEKIRTYSKSLSFDENKLIGSMCNNVNTPHEIKELYVEV